MDLGLSCAHGPLSLSFEFMAVDEAIGAVQTTIGLSWLTSRERLDWGLHEIWIPYRALAAFEAALDAASGPTQAAVLVSARGQTLLRVDEDARSAQLSLSSRIDAEPPQPETTGLCLTTEPGLRRALARAFRGYAKWW